MALSKVFIEGLKNVPGITFYDVGKKAKDKISLVFRYTSPEGKRTTVATKSFDPLTATDQEVLNEIKPLQKEIEGKIQKPGGNVNVIRENYTKAKIGFTDDLINWLETNAKDTKYKTPEQLLQGAEKAFNQPMYTEVPKKVEKSKVFFNKQKGFSLPRQYEFYGKDISTKNPKKPLTDMAMIALLKSDNPNFVGKKDLLLKYFARDPKSTKPNLYQESKEDRLFLQNFSRKYIARATGGAGLKGGKETGSVISRFLKDEGADFENKLNQWNEIRRLETDIKKELQTPGLTTNRINFLNKTLTATKDKRINVAEKLRKEYPELLSGKKGDISGALVQEHKVARAIGEKSKSFVPSTYLAKAEFTPAAFNLQKLKDFDTPLMKYIDQYNEPANKKIRPEIIKNIKELKKDFNLKSGGYLNDVDIQFGNNTVKIKDQTPYLFNTSASDTYSQILKNIKHSNTYFKNTGVDEKIISGDSFNALQKDLKTRIVNQKGSNLKSTLVGLGIGVPTANATLDAIEDNQLQAAEPEQQYRPPEDIEFGDPETWDKKVIDFMREYPIETGTAALGGTLATKTGRQALKKIGQAALTTPAGMVAVNTALGLDPKDPIDRVALGAELAVAPALVKGAEAMTKNQLLRKALTLGIGPRIAAGLSGIGIAGLAGEGLYQAYKIAEAEKQKIEAMSPEEKQGYLAEQQEQMGVAAASGGYVRDLLKDGGPTDPSKRKFMKLAAGIASIPLIGKYLKPAVKIAPAVVETVKRTAEGIPDFLADLIAKVKLKSEITGMKYFTGNKPEEFKDVYQADNYVVIEHGNKTTLRKRKQEGDMLEKDMEIELETDPETGGVTYNEATARPDAEGKLKDVEEFIDDVDLEDMKKYTYDD